MAMDLLTTATLITPSSIATGIAPTNDIKQQFRYIYNLAKQFDQQKQAIKTLSQIFHPKIECARIELVDLSTSLIYQTEYEAIARKSREILWFKGYYDLISLGKRFWKKQDAGDRPENQISNLLIEGIAHFKSVVVTLERRFELDLRNIVDFSFLDTYEKNMLFSTAAIQCNGKGEDKRDITEDQKKYAMETVHALLISLGDLHRYFIDFNFNMPKISKDFASNYYFEAFKLNPKTGMAHNQLGTLFTGLNYDLDSIYHYLYSLVCPVPFELSDVNVGKLFQANSEYLEKIDGNDIVARDFIARFILIVDVFFYDKEINDFNSLCHCMLMDFRKVLKSKRIDFSADVLFKMIAILLFCLVKLKSIGSNKIHHLNAFLVALCAEMVSSCTANLEQFITNKSEQNDRFQLKYSKKFDQFEQNVRQAREKHKQYLEENIVLVKSKKHDSNKNDFDSGKNSSTETGGNKLSSESANQLITKLKINGIDRDLDIAGGSSGRERESDMGKLSSSSENKNKKKQLKLRRRRKRANSDESDSDLSCNDDSYSDYEMDTDFSSDEDSVNDWSSSENEGDEFESTMTNGLLLSDSSEILNNKTMCENDIRSLLSSPASGSINGKLTNGHGTNSDDDIVIEEEEIVYFNNNSDKQSSQRFNDLPVKTSYFANDLFENMNNALNFHLSEGSDDVIVEEEQLVYGQFANLNIYQNSRDLSSVDASKSSSQEAGHKMSNGTGSAEHSDSKAPEKLRYKQKYNKIDPNIIIQFVEHEKTMRALKILFDWLRINGELLLNCFTTNPEFIEKIFTLINRMNIDIFTRKAYFERAFIETENVRENLRSLFDVRTTIPLNEDVLLKEFSALDQSQHLIDWTTPLKLKTTEQEENILRVFKIVDFGFSLCKMKKFKYNFCSRSRNFIQANAGKNRSQKRTRNRDRGRRSGRRSGRSGRRNRTHRRNDERELSNVVILTASSNDDRDAENCDTKADCPKKSYLRNRINQAPTVAEDKKKGNENGLNKHELMGKLWLQHEIEVLEAKVSKKSMLLTPYLVVDTKALINHFAIIKNLIKTKKFVVLVPKAVIADIDDLKKNSEVARNVTRWLENEFTRGNRFIRMQRLNETKPISLIKLPKKLDRDASSFVQITQFCNYMIDNHLDSNDKNNGIKSNDNGDVERPKIVTLLTGEKLADKKCSNLSYTGILNALSINFEQITVFYAKYKNK